jgi:hypothetical protein
MSCTRIDGITPHSVTISSFRDCLLYSGTAPTGTWSVGAERSAVLDECETRSDPAMPDPRTRPADAGLVRSAAISFEVAAVLNNPEMASVSQEA